MCVWLYNPFLCNTLTYFCWQSPTHIAPQPDLYFENLPRNISSKTGLTGIDQSRSEKCFCHTCSSVLPDCHSSSLPQRKQQCLVFGVCPHLNSSAGPQETEKQRVSVRSRAPPAVWLDHHNKPSRIFVKFHNKSYNKDTPWRLVAMVMWNNRYKGKGPLSSQPIRKHHLLTHIDVWVWTAKGTRHIG